jgi:hypothetical protein
MVHVRLEMRLLRLEMTRAGAKPTLVGLETTLPGPKTPLAGLETRLLRLEMTLLRPEMALVGLEMRRRETKKPRLHAIEPHLRTKMTPSRAIGSTWDAEGRSFRPSPSSPSAIPALLPLGRSRARRAR